MLHDTSGSPIYYDTEYPSLELYVGYSKLVLTLPPMLEAQTYFPTATAALSVPVPSSTGQLILIASISDLTHNFEGPMFVVFDKNSNWGSGTQKLDTPKIWFEHSPLYRKPILMRASGYEVTVQITPPPTTFTTTTLAAF